MKKILLSVCALLAVSVIFAQSNLVNLPSDNLQKGSMTMSIVPNPTPSTAVAAPPPIWYDDCSDLNTWTLTNSSTLGFDWEISYDPAEIPYANLSPIASTTASNGYMLINSDLNGSPTGTDGDGTIIEAEFTNATPIDLTNYPNVQLTFEHNFRWWQDTRSVRISPDNGVTWVEVDEISNNTTYTYPNQDSNNPHMSTYDISAVAGGQSQVLVQFYYNDHDIWAWYWAVDDVAISELPDNFIVSSDEVIGGWWIDYQTVGGLGQDYTSNPLSQATANPYAFESVLRNGGIATQAATMHAHVTGAGMFSTTSNTITLASGELDTVMGIDKFTPAVTGLYNVEMWAVADSAGAGTVYTYSDTATKMTMVTDYIYGKDNGSNDGGYWRLNRAGNPPGGFEVSSNYDIYADATLYSVDAHISDWSIPGAEVYVRLYEEDISGGDPILLDQTDNYVITQADLGAWVNIPFLSSQPLAAQTKMYRIAIGANLHPTDTVGVDVSDAGNYYSSDGLFDKDDVFANGAPTWYTISDIPMLRMNFNPATAVGVSDIKQTIFNVYPNPTNGVFDIALDETVKYDVTVYNVLGQIVHSGVTNAINTKTTIDLSFCDKGVYTVELKDENDIYTEKVIIE